MLSDVIKENASDTEFRDKQPPKSLVSLHRDTLDSTTSITTNKKKGGSVRRRKHDKQGENMEWNKKQNGKFIA